MSDPRPELRADVAEVLRVIGPQARGAVPILIDALTDPNGAVQQGALEALTAITGENFGTDVERWRQWWQSQQ
jgi:hypothetical protein